jgi:hypothetical protein
MRICRCLSSTETRSLAEALNGFLILSESLLGYRTDGRVLSPYQPGRRPVRQRVWVCHYSLTPDDLLDKPERYLEYNTTSNARRRCFKTNLTMLTLSLRSTRSISASLPNHTLDEIYIGEVTNLFQYTWVTFCPGCRTNLGRVLGSLNPQYMSLLRINWQSDKR